MSFIEQLTTNIKSPDGEDYTVTLGKNTVLIGDNEAGKSAIAEAAELARTGAAFGLLYRDKPVKGGDLLSALIPPGEEKAYAVASLDDGQECSWTLQDGKRPVRTGPNGVGLSVAELHAVLAGSEETKAKFFWHRLCEPKNKEHLKTTRVDEDLHGILDQNSEPDSDLVDLSVLLTKIGAARREQSAAVKASVIALESLGSIREVTDDEVAGLWDSLERAHARDLLRALYLTNKHDPATRAPNTLRHLVEQLGGQEAVQRIPETQKVKETIGEVILQRRLLRVGTVAKRGEKAAKNQSALLKDLHEQILEIMQRDIHLGCAKFQKKASSYLPKGESLHFAVDEDKLIIGLRKGMTATDFGILHTALSGSTEARVIAAMAAALADEENALLVVDDRMWDAATLAQTMAALEKAPCQVLIMSTMKPRGRARGAWTYINLAREEGQPLEIA